MRRYLTRINANPRVMHHMRAAGACIVRRMPLADGTSDCYIILDANDWGIVESLAALELATAELLGYAGIILDACVTDSLAPANAEC